MKLSRLFYLILAIPFSGCAMDAPFGIGTDTARWTEEVRQHDGTVIQLQREAKRSNLFTFPEKRGQNISASINYAPMNIVAKGGSYYFPVSFEIIQGQAYLVLYAARPEDCDGKQPSDFTATFLKWTDGQWEEISQQEAPLDNLYKNLYNREWGADSKTDARGLITLQKKSMKEGGEAYMSLSTYFKNGSATCERPLIELERRRQGRLNSQRGKANEKS